MSISSKMKVFAIAVSLSACCNHADARRHHRHHRHHVHHSARATVVPTPIHHHIVTSRVSNRFNPKERLAMALAYLNSNPRLTVKQYVKITSLSKEAAEAELDAFALEQNIPVHAIVDGKKKFYVIPAKIHD